MQTNKKGYYITVGGKKTELSPPTEKNEILNVSYIDIVELIVPEGYETVWCDNNQLTLLVLPDGVKEVYCYNNQLTSLVLPNGIKYISCNNNQLTSLVLPEGIKGVYCYNNQLTSLVLPDGVEYISCDIGVGLINLNRKETYVILYT